MVIKRYGKDSWSINDEDLPYQDVGRGSDGQYEDAQGNCYGKGAEADFEVIPFGCMTTGWTGSNDIWL